MKFYFKIIFLLLIAFGALNINAWDQTGHMISAGIAYKNLTSKTKNAINPLLKADIKEPVHVQLKSDNPDFLFCAAAPWADSIKYFGTWKNAKAKKFYADAHTMHAKVLYDNPDKITPEKAINDEIKITGSANSVKVIECCIKTLTSKKSGEDYKAIALRFLIHLVADQAQPVHVAYVCLKDKDGKLVSPDGANMIKFAEPSKDVVARYPDKEQHAYYLHGYWDLAGGLYKAVPMNNDVLYLDKNKEKYINEQSDKYIKDFSKLKPQILKVCSSKDWAVDTYKTAKKYAASLEAFNSAKIVSKGNLVINTPNQKYQKSAQYASEMQLYKAGIRLSALLDAIYDPENAPKVYVNYVNSISKDPNIKAIEQVQPLY